MDRFIVITANYAKEFQLKVNEALLKGYVLHGNAEFKATSHQSNWNNPDGTVSLRSESLHHYSQCLILY